MSVETPSVNEPYLGVAGSINLLMTIPERVWEAVEARQLVLAAQLYLLARHVHAALQVKTTFLTLVKTTCVISIKYFCHLSW